MSGCADLALSIDLCQLFRGVDSTDADRCRLRPPPGLPVADAPQVFSDVFRQADPRRTAVDTMR